jgi:hypothetical protein
MRHPSVLDSFDGLESFIRSLKLWRLRPESNESGVKRMDEEVFLWLAAVGLVVYALYLRFRRRELQHKERMAAIEKGVALPDLTDIEAGPRIYLLRGMIWLLSGLALSVFLVVLSATVQFPKSAEARFREANTIARLGGTAEQIKQAQDDTGPPERLPYAVSLIGLVPIGVGVAYLIFYRVESARSR